MPQWTSSFEEENCVEGCLCILYMLYSSCMSVLFMNMFVPSTVVVEHERIMTELNEVLV